MRGVRLCLVWIRFFEWHRVRRFIRRIRRAHGARAVIADKGSRSVMKDGKPGGVIDFFQRNAQLACGLCHSADFSRESREGWKGAKLFSFSFRRPRVFRETWMLELLLLRHSPDGVPHILFYRRAIRRFDVRGNLHLHHGMNVREFKQRGLLVRRKLH